MDLSVLIITYNRPGDTLALLQNLSTQQSLNAYVLEILLLNNASEESYLPVTDFIAANPQLPIQYIVHPVNAGVAGGRNHLIKRARGTYLLVLDDDILFPETDAIKNIAGILEKDHFKAKNTAIVTLNIHYYDTKAPQIAAFPLKKYRAFRNHPWFITYYFTGAAHLMRRELFTHTGYYPEDFFYGMEEYDLSYRVLNAGYAIGYDSSVIVWHKESPTGRVPGKEKQMMMWYNKSKVAWRYLPFRYFYSTALMWSLQYLYMTGFDWRGFLHTWKKIRHIPATETRTPISRKAMNYLRDVRARLWY
jgi:GT2 family glycosyltransferase